MSNRELSAGGVIYRSVGDTVEVALISVKKGKKWGLLNVVIPRTSSVALPPESGMHKST